MLKKVLECKNTLDEWYQNVWNTSIKEFPEFANNVQIGEKYKSSPVMASLNMPITVCGDLLQVTIIFSKEDEGIGKITRITVKDFGEIPILTRSYLPVNGF